MKKFLMILLLFCIPFFATEKPKIKGGIKELSKNIVYPEISKLNNIEGIVFVSTMIDTLGNIVYIKIEKGVDKELNSAAIRAIRKTEFIPGDENIEITIPIEFKLQKENK